MDSQELCKLAYRLYPHVATAEDGLNAEALATRIESLQKGLLPEDEFSATVMWLGNCAAIHRIDQTPMPLQVERDEMRAPDLLAFPIVNGRPMPVLIEVKSVNEKVLDWSEKYLTSIRTFAGLLNLPLLVAWKCSNMWMLVDCRHFEKNVTAYRLSFEKALKQDIMCALFRDLRIVMNSEVELIFDMEMLDEVPGDAGDLIPEGQLSLKIVGAGFYRNGERIIDKFDFALFLAALDDKEFRRTGKRTCQQIFRPLPDTTFTLSKVLVAQLSLVGTDDKLNWHQVLAKGQFPSKGREVQASLRAGLDHGFVRYVMDIVPNTWPDFLPPRTKAQVPEGRGT